MASAHNEIILSNFATVTAEEFAADNVKQAGRRFVLNKIFFFARLHAFHMANSDYDDSSCYSSDYDELATKLNKKRSATSSSNGPSKLLAQFEWKDWNKELQLLLQSEDTYLKYKAISDLANDFVFASSLYARIIISEYELPVDQKTIKPSHVGGIAGGTPTRHFTCDLVLSIIRDKILCAWNIIQVCTR